MESSTYGSLFDKIVVYLDGGVAVVGMWEMGRGDCASGLAPVATARIPLELSCDEMKDSIKIQMRALSTVPYQHCLSQIGRSLFGRIVVCFIQLPVC